MNNPKKIVNPYNKYILSTKISLVIAIATLLIAVSAIIITEYSLKHIDHQQTQLQQHTESLQNTLSLNQSAVQHLMHQSQQQDKHIDLLEQKIDHQFENGKRQWVEQAQQQLQLTCLLLSTQVNTTTSIQHLTMAQKTLSQLPASFYADTNTTIQQIINQLKQSDSININTTISMIQSLREMIGNISFTPENQSAFKTPSIQTNSSYWETSKDVIKQLFTVHYHSDPMLPIKNINQGYQLQQYLLLKASELEWCLLNNDYTLYQNNLKTIQQQIDSVVMNQHHQEAITQKIKTLQAIKFGFPRVKIISQLDTLLSTLSTTSHTIPKPSIEQDSVAPNKTSPKEIAPQSSTLQQSSPDHPLPSIEA